MADNETVEAVVERAARDWRVDLWNAINRYACTCQGDPSRHVYGNVERMRAVAEIERVVGDANRAVVAAVLKRLRDAEKRGDWLHDDEIGAIKQEWGLP